MEAIELLSIIENTKMLFAVLDINGNYLYFNNSYRETTFLMIGKKIEFNDNIFDVFEKDYAEKYLRNINTCINTQSTIESVVTRIINGEKQCYNRIIDPIYNKDKTIEKVNVYLVNVTENIEEIERLEELLRFEREFAEVIPIPIYYKDMDFMYVGVNSAYEEFMGKKRSEIIGKNVFGIAGEEYVNIFDEKEREEYAQAFYEKDKELLENGEKQIYETSLMNGKGEERKVILYKSVFKNKYQKASGIIGAIVDVTELRKMNEMREKFIKVLSHDLRLPLGSGKELLGVMLEDFENIKLGEIKENIEGLRKGLESTFDLVNNLLTWHRNVTHCEEKDTNITECIRDAIDVYQFSLTLKKQVLVIDCAQKKIMVKIGKENLETIIRNFISNAIKYSKESSTITIKVEEAKAKVILKVKDNGIGMTEEQIEKVLHTDAIKASHGTKGEIGSGIGMGIVKEIIHLCNGKLYIESEVGKGTTFIVELDRAG